jgi:hypothetical protein
MQETHHNKLSRDRKGADAGDQTASDAAVLDPIKLKDV